MPGSQASARFSLPLTSLMMPTAPSASGWSARSGSFVRSVSQLIASAIRHGHLPQGTDPEQWFHELMALRQAHHWAAGFMRDSKALDRSRAGFDRLAARRRMLRPDSFIDPRPNER
jgi:hypothetical protein